MMHSKTICGDIAIFFYSSVTDRCLAFIMQQQTLSSLLIMNHISFIYLISK